MSSPSRTSGRPPTATAVSTVTAGSPSGGDRTASVIGTASSTACVRGPVSAGSSLAQRGEIGAGVDVEQQRGRPHHPHAQTRGLREPPVALEAFRAEGGRDRVRWTEHECVRPGPVAIGHDHHLRTLARRASGAARRARAGRARDSRRARTAPARILRAIACLTPCATATLWPSSALSRDHERAASARASAPRPGRR